MRLPVWDYTAKMHTKQAIANFDWKFAGAFAVLVVLLFLAIQLLN